MQVGQASHWAFPTHFYQVFKLLQILEQGKSISPMYEPNINILWIPVSDGVQTGRK